MNDIEFSGDLLQSIEEINRFEKMLADEGALILKFWFHLSKEAQRRRLKALRSDPETRWRVTKRDGDFFRVYDRFYRISGETLRAASTAEAPWIVVEGADPPYRSLTVGEALLGAMRKRLDPRAERGRPVSKAAPIVHPIDKRDALTQLDLSRALTEKAYKTDLLAWQGRLNRLARDAKFPRLSVTLAFEGMDAAGKGSTIRRVTAGLDARLCGDQRFRGAARTLGDRAVQVLDADLQGGAAPALQGARAHALQALQDHA
jgi:polyphosphate kinase 2 (PPK2 family)